MIRGLPLLAAVATLSPLVFPTVAEGALRFERCGDHGYACARLSVPLDRAGTVRGRVSLFVARVRSRRRPARGVVFALAGGPGQSATSALDAEAFGPAYRERDLIVFDQRGTGRSGVLRCPALERTDLLDAGEAAGACARKLGPRRAHYTTPDSVEDIEAIRRELGAAKIVLYGTSYGTKVALGYALRYPANVESLVLDSVVEPAGPSPFYLDSFAAVPRVLRALCQPGCRSFTRDPVADLRSLLERMAGSPLGGVLVDARGRRRRASMTRADLFTLLLSGDGAPLLRSTFPVLVRAALNGDTPPLLRTWQRLLGAVSEPQRPRDISSALFAATVCEELALPWARTTPPDPGARRLQAAARLGALPPSSFLPFDRATALDTVLLGLCERWPAAPVAPALAPGPLPDVPVLLLAGEDDLRTPVESAMRVASSFPRSNLLVSPATGHSALSADGSGCARRGFARFLAGREVQAHCPPARRPVAPSGPPPRALREVPRARGVGGTKGRVLTAVGLTLRDVLGDLITKLSFDPRDPLFPRGGGLRARRYRLARSGTMILDGLAFIPGVRLSGRLRDFVGGPRRGRIRLSGPGTPAGRLAIRGARVSGRLAGRPVSARLGPLPAAVRAQAAAARLPAPPFR